MLQPYKWGFIEKRIYAGQPHGLRFAPGSDSTNDARLAFAQGIVCLLPNCLRLIVRRMCVTVLANATASTSRSIRGSISSCGVPVGFGIFLDRCTTNHRNRFA